MSTSKSDAQFLLNNAVAFQGYVLKESTSWATICNEYIFHVNLVQLL